MLRHTKVLLGFMAVALATVHSAQLDAQSSLTIYNDGRVLVRRTVAADVARGASTVRLPLGDLDPATLFSLDSNVVITTASYDGAVDESSIIRRAIGRTIKFVSGKDTIAAVVLGVDPMRFRMPDGTITFSVPGLPLYPADLVVIDPTVTLTLRSSEARKDLHLGYFTAGANWQANYEVILARRGTASVQGDATISVEKLRALEAELQLLAGSVSRAGSVRPEEDAKRMMMSARAADQMAPSEQKVGEFHLYTLPGKSTLLPGITSSISLFDPAQVTYERNLVVRGAIPWYGMLPQYGDEQEIPVEVSYTVKRPRKTDFGDRPLPGGVARLYEPDSSGRLQLIGEAAMDHTPAGEDLRLSAGVAFDITAKRVQTSYTTRRDSLRTWATADYSVTLTNASDSAATVDVMEQRPGEWSVLSSSIPGQKVSSTVTRFRVVVPAGGEKVLTYRVRVKW
ncbi:MAG: hypothetical protein ABI679_07460 [Gemmatimonadota bacterium]